MAGKSQDFVAKRFPAIDLVGLLPGWTPEEEERVLLLLSIALPRRLGDAYVGKPWERATLNERLHRLCKPQFRYLRRPLPEKTQLFFRILGGEARVRKALALARSK